jgi:hypothetical protein
MRSCSSSSSKPEPFAGHETIKLFYFGLATSLNTWLENHVSTLFGAARLEENRMQEPCTPERSVIVEKPILIYKCTSASVTVRWDAP